MTICVVEDCDRPQQKLEMCNRHYLRFRRHGTTELPPRKPRRDKKSPDERAAVKRDTTLRRKYGIGQTDYEARVASQADACAICGTTDKGMDRNGPRPHWAVDHNHATGEVRGLLCFECNTGLGKFRDNPDFLLAAAAYLIQYSTKAVPQWT